MEAVFRNSPEFGAVHSFHRDLLELDGHMFWARALCGHADLCHLHFTGQSFATTFEQGVSSRLYRSAARILWRLENYVGEAD